MATQSLRLWQIALLLPALALTGCGQDTAPPQNASSEISAVPSAPNDSITPEEIIDPHRPAADPPYVEDRQELINQLQKLGFQLIFPGGDTTRELLHLALPQGSALYKQGDPRMAVLKSFPETRALTAVSAGVTSEGLKHLQHVPQLRILDLRFSSLSKEAIDHIGQLPPCSGCCN